MANPNNLAPGTDTVHLHGFLCMYNNKEYEVWTDKGLYAAKLIAVSYFKVPKNKQHLLTAHLCVKPAQQDVIHVADF